MEIDKDLPEDTHQEADLSINSCSDFVKMRALLEVWGKLNIKALTAATPGGQVELVACPQVWDEIFRWKLNTLVLKQAATGHTATHVVIDGNDTTNNFTKKA